MAVLAAAALVDVASAWSPAPWQTGALTCWLALACVRAWRSDGAGALLARDGDEWYLLDVPTDDAMMPPAAFARHDPLTLLRPGYRSGWLVRLRLRDGAGRTRALDVWSDAVSPEAFSYLHLSCLFDAERCARERSAPR